MRLGQNVQRTLDMPNTPDLPDTPDPRALAADQPAPTDESPVPSPVAALQNDVTALRCALARLARSSSLREADERDILAMLGLAPDDADEAPLDA
jgi:hypothetical protein